MKDREYTGFVARLDDYGYATGTEPVVFREEDVSGLSIMDGAGIPTTYYACLKGFRQVQLQKSAFDKLIKAGKEVASHA